MDGMEDYTGEFIFDSEENTPSPLPILPDYDDNAGDALKAFDTAAAGEERGYLSPSLTFATPALEASSHSANGSHDSLSDSSSSKRTQSTASTKTTLTGGDVMMSDLPVTKEGWQFSDFIHGEDENTQDGAFQLTDTTFDDAGNLVSLATDAFTPAQSVSDIKSAVTSATSSPSPFNMAANALSPPVSNGLGTRVRKQSPPTTKGARGHTKGNSQFSLDQAMGGLNTNASREVSPFSNMATSHNSSPAAFRGSPSPSASFNFAGLPNGLSSVLPGVDSQEAASQWTNSLGLNPNSLQQGGTAPSFQMSGPISAAPGPFGYHIPIQMSYMGPGTQKYSLTVQPTPPKSRVETQIPIKLSLTPLPPGIKRLHLPTHTISKPKLLVKPTPEPSPDMLELHTVLVCTSAMQKPELKDKALKRALTGAMTPRRGLELKQDPDNEEEKAIDGGEVNICNGCVLRERKRAARKKVKKPEDEKLWQEDEVRRVIVFNTNEVKEWQQPSPPDQAMAPFQVDAPMRIACYCRHHNEKSGFQVIFTITDHRGNLIAQCLSPSIMITDDHKTHAFPQVQGGPTTSADTSVVPPMPATAAPLSASGQMQDVNSLSPPEQSFHLSPSHSDLAGAKRNSVAFAPGVMSPSASQPNSAIQTPKNLSRPASPTGHHGPQSKKRKASGGPTKVPSTLTMTRLDTSNLSVSQPSNPAAAGMSSASTSPFSPSLASFPGQQEQPLFTGNPHAPAPMAAAFISGPTTPGTNEQPPMFTHANRTASMDHLTMTQMYSAPASTHPSRPASPNEMRSNAAVNALQQQNSSFIHAQALAASLSPYNMPPRPPSVIHKIVPSEGPKSGGVEVTILGGGFFQGLEVMFGSNKATTTTFWGESSLVCLLPPSAVSGLVPVTLSSKQQPALSPQQLHKQPMFRYIDDDEQQILRTALSIMGHKMTGTFQDAAEIARKIIGDTGSGNWRSPSSGAQAPLNVLSLNGDFESQLLKILDLIDLDDSPHKARYNLRRSTGQTMLHLACAMGLNRFVAGLLARGANPDIRDKGGYTALHVAALNDHPEIVRRLILNGADPTIRTLSGLTASDVSQSPEVLRAVKRVERHVRSRSGGSLQHSRANSASSLKSLWGLSQVAQASDDTTDSAEESPEYTSEDLISEDDGPDADDGVWMGRRRSSVHDIHASETVPDTHPALNSPSAAVTALKEQFAAQLQQIHENFSMRLQNLPQFPYLLPQMPVMPPLPDYQAAVMQRLASMVPNINITRPGPVDQPPSAKDLDGRWWDLSSLMAPAGSAPPPAYNEIFPQSQLDMDTKQASAAQAAAEAEADRKCAAMFDQQMSTTVTSSSTATIASTSSSSAVAEESGPTTPKLPALLQIGRKNAVTKEQRENLRRAHAEKLKRLRADRNLFFVWIPLLIIVITAMLYNRVPGLFSAVGGSIALVFSYLASIGSPSKVTVSAEPLAAAAARVVEL